MLPAINQNRINYDRRRQKVPCKTRSEPQGSYQRGVRKKKARQERVFKTYSESGQKSSGNRALLYAPSQILAKKFCAVYLHRNNVKPSKLKNYGENDTERVEETR